MSFITSMRFEKGFINSYYGCQLVGSIKATKELLEKYRDLEIFIVRDEERKLYRKILKEGE